MSASPWTLAMVAFCVIVYSSGESHAAKLTVRLTNSENVTLVGAIDRWDRDGNAHRPVDPEAKIETPVLTARARRVDASEWVFDDLPSGRYDLVILAEPRLRIEGFHYPPVLEFDAPLAYKADTPEAPRKQVIKEIAQSRHYENKVVPLYFTGDDEKIRVLVQLLRDKPTSYDALAGGQVATLRHEVWQYTNLYGGWVKEKRTKVLDRILMQKEQLRRWTWIWEPGLGAVEITSQPSTITYKLPDRYELKHARGLLPY